jgi:glycosyltransferase involved in cell wall biosynthesis
MGEIAGSAPIAVVIPCFRAATSIVRVVGAIGDGVSRIYVVDDDCPDASGNTVRERVRDPRVVVLDNDRNLGVGGAVKRGYAEALRDGAEVIVKLDADGQMDPAAIPRLIEPILAGRADYAKGNRFAPSRLMPPASRRGSRSMPALRKSGNRLLSVLHKVVTGYWEVADPVNGFTAVRASVLRRIDLDRVADCWFFEMDMLCQLNLVDARVEDVPLPAFYCTEVSNLRLSRVVGSFPALALNRLARRLWVKHLAPQAPVLSQRPE